MDSIRKQIEELVLQVHHRNGGKLKTLDLSMPLLDPSLGLDSLDLAEIVVAVERRFNYSPFEAATPPSTWAEIVDGVAAKAPPGPVRG
jgi:acyl carrier protein